MKSNTLLNQTVLTKTQREFEEFCSQFPEVKWESHTAVIEAGRKPTAFYFIKSGCVKMSSTSSLGDTVTLHLFYPGACFAFLSLVMDDNQYDFDTVIETVAHKIPVEQMVNYLQEQPQASLLLNYKLLKGISGLLHRIEQSVFVSAYYQVAGVVYYFSLHFMDKKDGLITLKVTHKDISEWLGLSRENVSLQMKQLERDGVIARQGQQIKIINASELQRLATPQDILL